MQIYVWIHEKSVKENLALLFIFFYFGKVDSRYKIHVYLDFTKGLNKMHREVQ